MVVNSIQVVQKALLSVVRLNVRLPIGYVLDWASQTFVVSVKTISTSLMDVCARSAVNE